jgi:hypothetical protein
MEAEGAHELNDEGTHAHGAMGGFSDGGEGGDDRFFGGASAAAENRSMIEELLGEGGVTEIADDFVEGVDFFGVGAELIDDAAAALDATDERMHAGVETFEQGLGLANCRARVFVGGRLHDQIW